MDNEHTGTQDNIPRVQKDEPEDLQFPFGIYFDEIYDCNYPILFEPVPLFEPPTPYNFEFRFFTGNCTLYPRHLQRIREFCIRLNDRDLFDGFVRVLENEELPDYPRSRRSTLLMDVLISMLESEVSPRKLSGQNYLLECPIFEEMRESFGLLRLCHFQAGWASLQPNPPMFCYLVPLFESDQAFLPDGEMDVYFESLRACPLKKLYPTIDPVSIYCNV